MVTLQNKYKDLKLPVGYNLYYYNIASTEFTWHGDLSVWDYVESKFIQDVIFADSDKGYYISYKDMKLEMHENKNFVILMFGKVSKSIQMLWAQGNYFTLPSGLNLTNHSAFPFYCKNELFNKV